jgi:hypothetical protein
MHPMFISVFCGLFDFIRGNDCWFHTSWPVSQSSQRATGLPLPFHLAWAFAVNSEFWTVIVRGVVMLM